jgi:hypothetical protein
MKGKVRRMDPKDAVFLNRLGSHYEYSIPGGAQPACGGLGPNFI